MQKYVKAVKYLAETFKHFTLKQISRSKNKRVNALSKLASTSFDHMSKKKRYSSRSSQQEVSIDKKSS